MRTSSALDSPTATRATSASSDRSSMGPGAKAGPEPTPGVFRMPVKSDAHQNVGDEAVRVGQDHEQRQTADQTDGDAEVLCHAPAQPLELASLVAEVELARQVPAVARHPPPGDEPDRKHERCDLPER